MGIIPDETDSPTELRSWTADTDDLRRETPRSAEIMDFIKQHEVKTVIMSPGIIGCPHEEGIDYPKDEVCPECPYWADRDRWSGEKLPEQ